MTGIYTIIGIVMLVFGILQIVLFFKLWGMTNDVGQIKGLLSNLSTQKATAAMSSHDLEQTSSIFYSLINLHSHIPSSPVVTE